MTEKTHDYDLTAMRNAYEAITSLTDELAHGLRNYMYSTKENAQASVGPMVVGEIDTDRELQHMEGAMAANAILRVKASVLADQLFDLAVKLPQLIDDYHNEYEKFSESNDRFTHNMYQELGGTKDIEEFLEISTVDEAEAMIDQYPELKEAREDVNHQLAMYEAVQAAVREARIAGQEEGVIAYDSATGETKVYGSIEEALADSAEPIGDDPGADLTIKDLLGLLNKPTNYNA